MLAAGDPKAAATAMRQHIRSSMERMLIRLEPYFRMREKYADTFSRTAKKQLPLGALVEQAAMIEPTA